VTAIAVMERETFDPRIKWSPYIPHSPGEKQHAFLYLDKLGIEEALYGGQAGGGKSDAILMSALQYADTPGYAALILRQSYPDLSKPGAIMSRAKEWMRPTDAKWNENLKEIRFPSGAVIEFSYLKRDDDVYQYQSAEYQFIGFDELTQFTEFQYLYMKSRLRRLEGARVPLRMRSASNPGGKGHQWVRRYFIEPATRGNRVFIPASLDDNKHLDREAYRRQLEGLDPYTRAQLLHGDWSARPPGNWAFDHKHLDAIVEFGIQLDNMFKKGALPPPVDGKLMGGADFGEYSHLLIGWPREMSGVYVPREHTYEKGEPDREADDYIDKVDKLGFPLDRMRFDSSKPESMRLFARTLKKRRGEYYGKRSPIAFNKYKRAAILHVRGLASRTAWGEVVGTLGVSPTGCPVLVDQLYELQYKNEDSEDLVKKDDHGPDALFSLVAPDIKDFPVPLKAPPKKPEPPEEADVLSPTLSAG
jgi:hypothetical protein